MRLNGRTFRQFFSEEQVDLTEEDMEKIHTASLLVNKFHITKRYLPITTPDRKEASAQKLGYSSNSELQDKLFKMLNVPAIHRVGKILQDSWFGEDYGEETYKDLFREKPTGEASQIIMKLATRRMKQPMILYRNDWALAPNLEAGDKFWWETPKAFTAESEGTIPYEEVRYVVDRALYGTAISALSFYPLEAEVVSFDPNGYLITDILFDKILDRQVVYLEPNT